MDTAWAHVVGNSPYVDDALSLLFNYGEEEVKALLYNIREEVIFMPELQKSLPEPGGDSGAYRFLKAWEVAASRQEGRLSADRQAVLRVARLRFGEVEEVLLPGLDQIRSPGLLEELHAFAVLSPSIDALTERVRAMAGEGSTEK